MFTRKPQTEGGEVSVDSLDKPQETVPLRVCNCSKVRLLKEHKTLKPLQEKINKQKKKQQKTSAVITTESPLGPEAPRDTGLGDAKSILHSSIVLQVAYHILPEPCAVPTRTLSVALWW